MSSTTTSAPSATSAASACITATPGKNGYVPIDDCRAIWPYSPSFAAAILFVVLFGMSNIIHIFQAFTYRKKFCWVIIMAATWETTGFVLRSIASRHQLNLQIYLPEELFILLSPIWINAFDYMILGRMVHYFLPEQKVFGISAIKFAKYFVWLDIVAFLIQATGGSMISGGNSSSAQSKAGLHIYMGGIGLQQFFILVFTSAAVAFHRRMLVLEKQGALVKWNWRPLLYTLYASLTLVSVRIIYRLVQYSSGFLSTIPLHEAYFYCFEALPMALALLLMNITHPGRSLVGPESEFPTKTREEKKEEKRQKKEAKKAKKEQKKWGKTEESGVWGLKGGRRYGEDSVA